MSNCVIYNTLCDWVIVRHTGSLRLSLSSLFPAQTNLLQFQTHNEGQVLQRSGKGVSSDTSKMYWCLGSAPIKSSSVFKAHVGIGFSQLVLKNSNASPQYSYT